MAQTRRRGTVMQLQHSKLVKFSHFVVLNVCTAGQLRECHSNLLCFISFCCSKWFYSTDPFITNRQAWSSQSGELGRFPVGRANIWAPRARQQLPCRATLAVVSVWSLSVARSQLELSVGTSKLLRGAPLSVTPSSHCLIQVSDHDPPPLSNG